MQAEPASSYAASSKAGWPSGVTLDVLSAFLPNRVVSRRSILLIVAAQAAVAIMVWYRAPMVILELVDRPEVPRDKGRKSKSDKAPQEDKGEAGRGATRGRRRR